MRHHLREWGGLLSKQRYHDAVDWLSPEIPDQSGSTSHTIWTPEFLETVISNYGLDEPIEGVDWRYSVAPLTADMEESFENSMWIDYDMWEDTAPDGARLAGAAHVDLPLYFEKGAGMSDLTARFMFKHLEEGNRALVLLDVHAL